MRLKRSPSIRWAQVANMFRKDFIVGYLTLHGDECKVVCYLYEGVDIRTGKPNSAQNMIRIEITDTWTNKIIGVTWIDGVDREEWKQIAADGAKSFVRTC